MAIVLIADDRKEDVKNLIDAIENKGHGVVYCSYSLDAQRKINTVHFDCAIYDVMMPRYEEDSDLSAELGGLLLVHETRRKSPDTRMVMHTSGLEGALKDKVYGLGVPVFIKSDNRVDEIIRTLGL
jgi:CheY-like chemotaxis protein